MINNEPNPEAVPESTETNGFDGGKVVTKPY